MTILCWVTKELTEFLVTMFESTTGVPLRSSSTIPLIQQFKSSLYGGYVLCLAPLYSTLWVFHSLDPWFVFVPYSIEDNVMFKYGGGNDSHCIGCWCCNWCNLATFDVIVKIFVKEKAKNMKKAEKSWGGQDPSKKQVVRLALGRCKSGLEWCEHIVRPSIKRIWVAWWKPERAPWQNECEC